MSLLDLSLVTQTLINVIKRGVETSPAWTSSGVTAPLLVSARPPDELDGGATLGLYLFHLEEDPHSRNRPAAGDDSVGVQSSPMGLVLRYQLTAFSDANTRETATAVQQLLTGCAVKTLHDFPIIDDKTQIAGTVMMPIALRGKGNLLRVELDTVDAEQASTYWAAGEKPVRLAARYKVSVVMLDAEPPATRPRRVLTPRVDVYTLDTPRLSGSSSVLEYSVPGTAAQRIELRPAQGAAGDTIQLYGSGFGWGVPRVVLSHMRRGDEIDVSGWNPTITSTQIDLKLQRTAGATSIIPGVYTAAIVATRTSGTATETRRSNETPLAIAPLVTTTTINAAIVTINGFGFRDALLDESRVEVFTGATRLTAGAAAAAGIFKINSATRITCGLPLGTPTGLLAVRVIVDGVESAPRWIQVP
jgi:uncharacterized protein DUF4255